jgi:hypothetical protein
MSRPVGGGLGKGGQLPGQGEEGPVQGFGMQPGQAREMAQRHLVAIDQHQDQEVGDLSRPLAARARQARGDRAAAVVQQAPDLRQPTFQDGGGRARQDRRRETGVEHDRPIEAFFHQPRDGQGDVARQVLAIMHQAEVELADHYLGVTRALREGVGDLNLFADPADHLVVELVETGGDRARAAYGKGEVEDGVAQIARRREGRRVVVVARNVEGRSVRHQAGGPRDREHAGIQKRLVDLQLSEAPPQWAHRRRAGAHQLLDVALELLKVLGAEEHPLRPKHLVFPPQRHERPLGGGPAAPAGA